LINNPALELVEADICSRCGNARNDDVCYFCLDQERSDFDQESTLNSRASRSANDEEFDMFSIVVAPRTLAEELTELAHTAVAKQDHFIAEYLIAGLADNGMLDIQIGDAVRTLGVETQRVREVLAVLQRLSPPGTFARDPQECLLLQLERLDAASIPRFLATLIIESHMVDLAQGRYLKIAQALRISLGQVMEVREFIRDHLRPFPILSIGESEGTQVVDTSYVTPDVIIREDVNSADGFTIEIIESRRFALRVSPIYREMVQSLRRDDADGISDDERRHVLDHVGRAQQFIGYLRHRRSTLERVAMCVVRLQKAYLMKGIRYLTPLTMLRVADELGLHVSTVSRAVSDKYILLPWQQVKPMRIFFEVEHSIHDLLQEMIAGEDYPLSDVEIAKLLATHGHPVARRTVTKYRNRLGILSSRLR
jgi:RNA polymerase sigma-54 factor